MKNTTKKTTTKQKQLNNNNNDATFIKNGAKMDPEIVQHGSQKTARKVSERGPRPRHQKVIKLEPKLNQNGTKMEPK